MDDSVIISFLTQYKLVAIFLGSFFFGEAVVLAATFLSAEGLWSPGIVFSLSFLGTIAADTVWFLLGRKLITFASRWEWVRARYAAYLEKFVKKEQRDLLPHFLFFKFLYGTRIITIIFVSLKQMRLGRFIFLDSLGTIVWLIVLIATGWLTWKGAASALPILHNLEYALVAVVIFVVLLRAIIKWTSKRIIEKNQE